MPFLYGEVLSVKTINGSTEFEHVPKQPKNVNTVHNKAVRALVCARKRDPLSKIFRELKPLKLIDIYYYNLGIFAYQTFTSGCPHFFDNYAISHNKHVRYVTRSTKNTVFDFTSDPRCPAKHAHDHGHNIDWNGTSIVTACAHRSQLNLLEHAAITILDPPMNIQHKGPRVNPCWNPLLDTIARNFKYTSANVIL